MARIPVRLPRDPNDFRAGNLFFDTDSNKLLIYSDATFQDIAEKAALSNVQDADILNKIKNVDGPGSGLDADTVDGKHASDFARAVHTHTTADITNISTLARVDLSNVNDNVILTKLTNVDGSGSGLDADTLDGLHATDFVRQDSAGNVIISGNLETAIVKGINVLKTFPPAIPEGSTAYFKKQLIDELAGIKPEGYDTSTITSYGLRTSSDGTTLVVTERSDDVPFPGVKSFAVEEGTTNLLPNPSFETYTGTSGVADNWLSASNPTVTPNYSVESIGYNSNRSQKIEITNSTGLGDAIVYRWHTLTIGSTYTLSAYVRGNVTGTCVGFVRIAPKPVGGTTINTFVPTNQWQRVSVTATIPEKTSFCEITVGLRAMTAGDIGTLYIDNVQLEEKPFATSFTEGTRPHGIVKLTNPPLPLDNFVINLWFKPTRYPTQNGKWWHLFDVSYNASAFQGLELCAPSSAHSGIPANTLSLTASSYTRYNLGFDLSAEIGKWHMITLISNGNTVDVYIDAEKRVSAINNIPRSAIEFIVFGRWFGNVSATRVENGFLMANPLFASYDPAIWTDEYIRFLYETQKPFFV